MKKYEITYLDKNSKKLLTYTIESDNDVDFNKMFTVEKDTRNNLDKILVIIDDKEVRFY